MNIAAIYFWVEEIVSCGPDIVTAFRDSVRAFNDFRAGKLTADEFTTAMNEWIAVVVKLFGAKAPAA